MSDWTAADLSFGKQVEDFERVVKVNLVGNFIVAQAVARVMRDQSPDAKGFRGVVGADDAYAQKMVAHDGGRRLDRGIGACISAHAAGVPAPPGRPCT